MKKIIILLLLLAIVSISANAENIIFKDNTEICSTPGGKVIGMLFKDTEIKEEDVVDLDGSWIRIAFESNDYMINGWVNLEGYSNNEDDKSTESSNNNSQETSSDFKYDNINFVYDDMLNYTKIIGEVTNNSGKDYSLANFVVSLYTSNGKLVDTAIISVSNIKNGQKKSFSGMVNLKTSNFSKYNIQFENGY